MGLRVEALQVQPHDILMVVDGRRRSHYLREALACRLQVVERLIDELGVSLHLTVTPTGCRLLERVRTLVLGSVAKGAAILRTAFGVVVRRRGRLREDANVLRRRRLANLEAELLAGGAWRQDDLHTFALEELRHMLMATALGSLSFVREDGLWRRSWPAMTVVHHDKPLVATRVSRHLRTIGSHARTAGALTDEAAGPAALLTGCCDGRVDDMAAVLA